MGSGGQWLSLGHLKCSELWGSRLPKLERAKAWQHDTVNDNDNDDDDEGEDDNYDDNNDIYWAITVWKPALRTFHMLSVSPYKHDCGSF